MSTVKYLFVGVVLLFVIFNLFSHKESSLSESDRKQLLTINKNIKFKDPALASRIIRIFDKSYFMGKDKDGPSNLVNYCKHSLHYMVHNPKYIFTEMNFFTNCMDGYLPKESVMKVIGDFVQEKDKKNKKRKDIKGPFEYNLDTNSFFWQNSPMSMLQIHQKAVCSHQLQNHIPGNEEIVDKGLVANNWNQYREKFVDRPHCLDDVMPATYVLNVKSQCLKFFEFIDSEVYYEQKAKYHIVFMEKLGSGQGAHGATGVKPFDDERELVNRQIYNNGQKCGKVAANTVMQAYIPDPFTIKQHKFDIRAHFLVASMNPLVIYYYDGYFRVSPWIFDPNSDDPNVHMSNTHQTNKDEMTKEDADWFAALNYTSFGTWMYEQGHVSDPDWINNNLRFRMKRAFMHLINSTIDKYDKQANLYEMFGCDFLLDSSLDMWFIECNSDPSYSFPGRPKAERNTKMLIDHFEIMFGYLRSRMKRQLAFVNQIIDELGTKTLTNDELKEVLKPKRDTFLALKQNYFEPEYTPSTQNAFVKIVDENLNGPERYGNLVSRKCM
jgi:hypothetical protein